MHRRRVSEGGFVRAMWRPLSDDASRRHEPQLRHWKWHLDEMYVKLNGEMVYLWRAVDHEGEILESYVTRTRDKAAALGFMKKAPLKAAS
jgi:transposase-like protein